MDTLPYISPMGWGCPLWPELGCWSKSIQGIGSGLEPCLLFILTTSAPQSYKSLRAAPGTATRGKADYPWFFFPYAISFLPFTFAGSELWGVHANDSASKGWLSTLESTQSRIKFQTIFGVINLA